jgi:hypothetical protein
VQFGGTKNPGQKCTAQNKILGGASHAIPQDTQEPRYGNVQETGLKNVERMATLDATDTVVNMSFIIYLLSPGFYFRPNPPGTEEAV